MVILIHVFISVDNVRPVFSYLKRLCGGGGGIATRNLYDLP